MASFGASFHSAAASRRLTGLAIVLIGLLAGGCSGCDEPALRAVQAQFTTCRGERIAQYHHRQTAEMSKGVEKGRQLCTLLSEIVTECGALWSECHTDTDITIMRNMHIKAFIQQWDANEKVLEGCRVVEEYRSEMTPVLDSEIACSPDESMQSTTEFHTCSERITTNVYNSINGLGSAADDQIKVILCEGLANIAERCPPKLAACHAKDDIQQISLMHMDQMKEYFGSLVMGRVENLDLSTCQDEEQDVKQSKVVESKPEEAWGSSIAEPEIPSVERFDYEEDLELERQVLDDLQNALEVTSDPELPVFKSQDVAEQSESAADADRIGQEPKLPELDPVDESPFEDGLSKVSDLLYLDGLGSQEYKTDSRSGSGSSMEDASLDKINDILNVPTEERRSAGSVGDACRGQAASLSLAIISMLVLRQL